MALERPHSINNYIYLNDNINEPLRTQNFSRVSKVFIEFEESYECMSQFEFTPFYYALDAITNMIELTVYLPDEEQCEIFRRRARRHSSYHETNRLPLKKKDNYDDWDDEIEPRSDITKEAKHKTQEAIDNLFNDQSLNTISSLIADNESSSFNYPSPITKPSSAEDIKQISEITEDSASKMSYQSTCQDETIKVSNEMNLIENHFKSRPNPVDMEMSIDEGIGSSGSLSNNHTKCSPILTENFDHRKMSPSTSRDESNILNRDLDHDLKLKLLRNENYIREEDEDNDNETHLGDVADRNQIELDDLDEDFPPDLNYEDDDTNYRFPQSSDSNYNDEPKLVEEDSNKVEDPVAKSKQRVKFADESANQGQESKDKLLAETKMSTSDSVSYPSNEYRDLNKKISPLRDKDGSTVEYQDLNKDFLYQKDKNGYSLEDPIETRFIKSNLMVNYDLDPRSKTYSYRSKTLHMEEQSLCCQIRLIFKFRTYMNYFERIICDWPQS